MAGRVLLAVAGLVAAAAAVPVKLQIGGSNSALVYLTKFGYLDPAVTNPQSGALISEQTMINSIREFQAFAGLNQTGELDDLTLEMMNTPRCGVKDKVGYGSNARRKRYALQGSRWRVKDLTYRITKYPRGLLKNDVDREIESAFKVWEGVTELTFRGVTSGKVHIEIRFEKGEHGDGDPFDGPGGTLAHAYFPIYGGDAHFDDTEAWTINSIRGTNLFQVSAHEFGHSLGLSHSDVRASLMAPFYRGYEEDFNLNKDDVQGIQALYGKKTTRPTPPTQRPTPPSGGSDGSGRSDGSLCRDTSIDAIVTMSDKETYVFKDSLFWKLTDEGVATGYPKKISSKWSGLPSNLDAAFTWTNGKTYFFKGSQYWRFSDLTKDPGYPKLIRNGFAGIPNSIDGAFVWSGNGKIYFFKGPSYWRFDPAQRPPVKTNYPKPISNWEGLPDSIDDALQYSNGYTYFFKEGNYWRFNDRAFRVDTADPAFPRRAGYWWFGCSDKDALISASHQQDRGDMQPPSASGDTQDDTFDADGSDDPADQLLPRMAGSRSVGYQEGETESGSLALTSSHLLSLALSFLPTLLLRL